MDIQSKHIIINSDSRQMKEIEDSSIDLIITSPPYWQLKDYGTKEQIGYNDNYEEYINNLNLVWQECYRVLNNGSRLCINIGDQFARAVYYGRYKVIPIRTEIIKFCETIGFDYMGAIIWQKKTTSNTTGGASLMGSYPFPKNGIISIDYEFILLFKKLGSTQKPDKERKELSRLTKEEWREYFSGHWSFGGAKQNNHIAMFPEELPKRLIKMFSFVGDNILDPFTGSGTTSLAAQKLNRNSFGYEINPDFIPIIKNKLNINQKSIFYSPTYKFISPPQKTTNFQQKINKLPYTYKDTNSFDKKVDPHKLKFGSKIKQNDDNKNDNLYSIKEIITPTIFRLSNNIIVKLIGVKEKKETTKNAIEFLKLKTAKQKVFFKYDDIKYDKENNLMVYLYLKNKTFINAHLIKNGFAVALKNIEYKNKNKFIKLEERHAKQLT